MTIFIYRPYRCYITIHNGFAVNYLTKINSPAPNTVSPMYPHRRRPTPPSPITSAALIIQPTHYNPPHPVDSRSQMLRRNLKSIRIKQEQPWKFSTTRGPLFSSNIAYLMLPWQQLATRSTEKTDI